MSGKTSAASMPTIARTQTISISVKPASSSIGRLLRRALDHGRSRSGRVPRRAARRDLIGRVVAGNLVKVGMAPRVERHGAGSQIRAVPGVGRGRTLNQRGQAFV